MIPLDDLRQTGVSEHARAELRALIADLPLVPDASLSAELVGPASATLPCLAVLARHVGQGLRDHNLGLAHDRPRLRLERRKLVFLAAGALEQLLIRGDERPHHEAVLFVQGTTPAVLDLLAARQASGLASYVTSSSPHAALAHWRQVALTD
jgi:hypothetical protein